MGTAHRRPKSMTNAFKCERPVSRKGVTAREGGQKTAPAFSAFPPSIAVKMQILQDRRHCSWLLLFRIRSRTGTQKKSAQDTKEKIKPRAVGGTANHCAKNQKANRLWNLQQFKKPELNLLQLLTEFKNQIIASLQTLFCLTFFCINQLRRPDCPNKATAFEMAS
ncbi:MAG TPA: hypothetical protein VF268_14115 [Gammaproteobacteria bacterium]